VPSRKPSSPAAPAPVLTAPSPGPYHPEHFSSYGIAVCDGSGRDVAHLIVRDVHRQNGKPHPELPTVDEAWSTARLLAAAPAMRDALLLVRSVLGSRKPASSRQVQRALRALNGALAEANTF
jgi:hypothetical protein